MHIVVRSRSVGGDPRPAPRPPGGPLGATGAGCPGQGRAPSAPRTAEQRELPRQHERETRRHASDRDMSADRARAGRRSRVPRGPRRGAFGYLGPNGAGKTITIRIQTCQAHLRGGIARPSSRASQCASASTYSQSKARPPGRRRPRSRSRCSPRASCCSRPCSSLPPVFDLDLGFTDMARGSVGCRFSGSRSGSSPGPGCGDGTPGRRACHRGCAHGRRLRALQAGAARPWQPLSPFHQARARAYRGGSSGRLQVARDRRSGGPHRRGARPRPARHPDTPRIGGPGPRGSLVTPDPVPGL